MFYRINNQLVKTCSIRKVIIMKKLCLFIMVALMCTMLFPLAAQAEEASILTYDELIELSCAAFPEHADNILNPDLGEATTYALRDPVVIEKSKAISDNEIVTYQEMASGRAFLSFSRSWNPSTTSSGTVKGILYVYCNLSPDYFALHDFEYKINNSGYDSIINFGRTYLSTCSVTHGTNSVYEKRNEDASGDAYAHYNLLFYPDDYAAITPSSCGVTLAVGGNNFKLTVNGATTTNPTS